MDIFVITMLIEKERWLVCDKINNEYSVLAYRTLEEALEYFSLYKEALNSTNFKSAYDTVVSLTFLNPVIIKIESSEQLTEYFTDGITFVKNKGIVYGTNVSFIGIKLKDSVRKLAVCDVATELAKPLFS